MVGLGHICKSARKWFAKGKKVVPLAWTVYKLIVGGLSHICESNSKWFSEGQKLSSLTAWYPNLLWVDSVTLANPIENGLPNAKSCPLRQYDVQP